MSGERDRNSEEDEVSHAESALMESSEKDYDESCNTSRLDQEIGLSRPIRKSKNTLRLCGIIYKRQSILNTLKMKSRIRFEKFTS